MGLPELVTTAAKLEADARAELADGGADPAQVTSVHRAHLRYAGTDTALPVPLGRAQDMIAAFERAYRQQFSFLMPDKTIEVEAVSVEAVLPGGAQRSRGTPPDPRWPGTPRVALPPAGRCPVGGRCRLGRRAAGGRPFRCMWTEGGPACRSPGDGTCGQERASRGPR